jgi:hypothetical protein
MTTASTKPVRTAEPAKPATHPQTHRHTGRQVGALAINAYERSVANVVAFEKDAAEIAPAPWKSALTLSAELIEEVNAAYVKTARQALR